MYKTAPEDKPYLVSDKASNKYARIIKKSKQIIYDPLENKYCSRTLPDWIRFWIFFFACTITSIGIFIAMFYAFTEGVINEDNPFRSGPNTILFEAPSLSYRPVIDFKTSLIKYSDVNPSTYMQHIHGIRTFIQTYEDAGLVSQDSYAMCKDGIKIPDDINYPCRFDLSLLDRCRKQYNFGYDRSRPCVIVKLNRVYGWIPEVTNSSLTKDILVSCQGNNMADIEYFPNVLYYPNVTIDGVVYGYFNHLYYPYLVQYGYRQPIIAIELNSPKKNVVLMVMCRLVNLKMPSLPLTFEILVD